jgi:hypothetical protein
MQNRLKTNALKVLSAGVLAVAANAGISNAQTLVADYGFNNTLNSSVAGAPALTAVDPLSANGFSTATVFGGSHSVYNYVGNTTPASQAGLSLNTTGLVAANDYSVQMVMSVNNINGDGSGWVRLLDVQNRTSDNGLYYDPSHQVDIYPVTAGGAVVTDNTFEDVVLTVAPDNTVKAYLNHVLAFTTTTGVMEINNPDNIMNFFLDNTQAGGQGEFSSGSVAEIKLFSGVLSGDQVDTLDANPLGSVPDAGGSLALMTTALVGIGAVSRKLRRQCPA